MPDVIRQPLMVFRAPATARIRWVATLQLLKYSECQSLVDDIVGVMRNDLRSVHLHSTPHPASKAEDLLVEVVREPLRPRGEFLSKILVKDFPQGHLVPNLLVTGCLVDQCQDSHSR